MSVEFTETVPTDWRITRFGECAEITMGQSPAGDTYNAVGDGLPLLNGPAEFGRWFPRAVQWTTTPTRLAEKGDILFCVRGNTTGRMNRSDAQYCIGRGLAAIRGKDGEANTQFVALLLEFIKPRIYSVAIGGGSTFPNISRSGLSEFEVPRPPLPEQQKIAGVLRLVQRAMEQQERLIEKTAELKKTLLHQLFTQGTRGEPQKQTDLGPIPESWDLVPLGKLAKVGNGSTPKRDNVGYWEGGTISWLNSARIHDRFITEADQFVTDLAVRECHLPRVKSGSLLVAITGQGKTLGNTALVRFETCINQHLAYAQFTSDRILPEFALWFMQTRYDHLRSISQAGGSTKGALTCGYLKTYLIPVPALEEQKKIAATFAALDAKEKHHRRKHAALSALFRTLLHQLMTAQLRVHDLDLDGVLEQAVQESAPL